MIIIPSYGNSGVCWEPYERNNKATSRGRIAIPMFPGDLRMAVIIALGIYVGNRPKRWRRTTGWKRA